MKVNLNNAKATKCFTIAIIVPIPFSLSCAKNTNQNSANFSTKTTPLSLKAISPATTARYSITERQDFKDYTLIDANVASSVTQSQLQKYVDAITKEVKPKKGLVIWFYNGNKSLGTYDYRNRNKVNKGLTFGDTPSP